MPTPVMSDHTTRDIRIGAAAFYLPHESDPQQDHWVFGYNIVIANNSDRTVQLLRRNWQIIDGDGTVREVQGDGVVGQQPILEPGKAFKYSSFAQLATTWGTMEGHYVFEAEDGEQFDVDVARFYLTTDRLVETHETDQDDSEASN